MQTLIWLRTSNKNLNILYYIIYSRINIHIALFIVIPLYLLYSLLQSYFFTISLSLTRIARDPYKSEALCGCQFSNLKIGPGFWDATPIIKSYILDISWESFPLARLRNFLSAIFFKSFAKPKYCVNIIGQN